VLYKVTTKIERLQEGKPLADLFRDGAGNAVNPTQCIFPVFHFTSGGVWKGLGTGFFISSNGFFATAKHNLVDQGKLLDRIFGVQILTDGDRPTVRIRQILNVTVHPTADLAIGFLEFQGTENNAFHLTERLPEKGDAVAAFAISRLAALSLDGGSTEFQFAPNLLHSVLEAHWPDGAILQRNNVFQSGLFTEFGASGGPVFFGEGDVFAINSSGNDGEPPYSFHSSIADLLDLKVAEAAVEVNGNRKIKRNVSVRELATLGVVKLT
jgi:hypothetical protein